MPNRIIKDSIRTSKSVNSMTDFQFRLWVYLITYVDDYGRGSADPELLKGFVFPRRKGVTESTIEKALADLANSGSILLYDVDGESYFCFPNWSDHQRIQTKHSKFPAPSNGNIKKSTVSNGESPSESNPIRIQSESKYEYESEIPAAREAAPTFAWYVAEYNRICVGLPKASKVNESRKKAITARLNAGYTPKEFTALFEKAQNSAFLKGANEKNWRADFDWLITDKHMAKTLEGAYDARVKEQAENQTTEEYDW